MYNKFNYKQDRFGFAAPFLLGGLTGAFGMAAFRPRPNMYYQYPYQMSYPYNYYPYY